MSSTQSIITHSQKSHKSIFRMFMVILVHTGMYLYVLGTYMYVPTARHVLFLGDAPVLRCLGTTIYMFHTHSIVSHSLKSKPCLPSRLLGKLCTDPFVPVCTCDVLVHTSSDHTHTSFSIRHYQPCNAHVSPSCARPMLCWPASCFRRLMSKHTEPVQFHVVDCWSQQNQGIHLVHTVMY